MSGVATSALGGWGLDGASSRNVFSLVPVPEIHWLLSDLLAFPDTDDSFLSFCLQSQDPFSQVFFSSRVSSHGICCTLQATMNKSLPFFHRLF